MSRALDLPHLPRREFLKTGGVLLVGFTLARRALAQEVREGIDAVAFAAGPDQPDPRQLDTWIAVHADNTASILFGFAELGQGNNTALLQIAAEELDLDMSQVKAVRLDTVRTPNQGGTVASASIGMGGPRVRSAAAEARQALLRLAAQKLGAPPERLTVSRGGVALRDEPRRTVTYGELIGDKRFNVPFTGNAPLKSPGEYKIVGTRVPRNDIPDKVSGKYVHMQHVTLPGMLHARLVRPRGQAAYGVGATLLSLEEDSIRDIPGARVVRKRNFVAVIAPEEWDAVRAARQLKVTWDTSPSLSGHDGLQARMRAAKTEDAVVLARGDVNAALAKSAHVVSRTCFAPYQSHGVFAPNCAVADVTASSALVICSTQNLYETRQNLSALLGLPPKQVRVQYYEGSGTYGHSCYEDTAQAAALISQTVGRPVRLQLMRWDEFGWDNYGPAHLSDIRVGADADGNLLAYEYLGSQHTWIVTETTPQLALGTPALQGDGPVAQRISPLNLGSMYGIPNVRLLNRRVLGLNDYPKGSYLRSPLDIAICFTSEGAIDDLAYMLGMDPFLFRESNIKDPRWLAVLRAAAQAAGWKPRRAASQLSREKIVSGRGIAVGTHLSSYAAAVAEIELNRETGQVVARRMYGALDAGLAVNPAFVENQISGMLVQAASRMLKEEVTFTATNVTSLDWNSYPVLRFEESPEVTPIVVQRLEERSTGGGEEILGPAASAIANAFFDATGVRMTEYPLTPPRVQAALMRS